MLSGCCKRHIGLILPPKAAVCKDWTVALVAITRQNKQPAFVFVLLAPRLHRPKCHVVIHMTQASLPNSVGEY